MKREIFEIFAEFATTQAAQETLDRLAWNHPDLIDSCDRDDPKVGNDRVLKLYVTSLDSHLLALLAGSISCERITRDHMQLFPRLPVQAASA